MFVTFEGGEGAGKSSAIDFLHSKLVHQGFDVLVTREPGGTALGQKIRKMVLDPFEQPLSKRAELLLFLADRSQHVEEKIRPFLAKGGIVLCDRFIDSSLAYQSGVLPEDELYAMNLFATGGLIPDRTYYLDMDPEVGLKRITRDRGSAIDRIESKELQFHREVRLNFLRLALRYPSRIVKIDAEKPQQHVHHVILDNISQYLYAANRPSNPS